MSEASTAYQVNGARQTDALPTHVKVGTFDYRIEANQRKMIRGQSYGETNYEDLIIEIDDSNPLQHLQVTLFHEILHAVCEAYLLPKDHLSHDKVKLLGHVLVQVFKDNPEVMDFISGRSK